MSEELILEHPKIYRSQQGLYKNNSHQKKLFSSNFGEKKNFYLIKNKARMPLDMTNIPKNIKFIKTIYKPSNKFSNSQLMITQRAGNRFRKIKQIDISHSQKLFGNKKLLYDSYSINSKNNYENAEKILQKKIDEVNKTLLDNENIFRYNQKLMRKRLEEKNKEIDKLKIELKNEKFNKQSFIENIYNESKSNFIDDIKQLQKQIEKLNIKNEELSEQILEYKEKIENLENKNKINISKLEEMNKKYDLLIQEKTNDILEEEIKNYIKDLNSRLDSSQNELNSLNEEMLLLSEENKKLRFLTKEIIEERSDTEIFFLDALNDVKMELYKQKKEQSKRDCFFPRLKSFYEDEKGIMKLDIKELTPELREKILRNLFEKINKSYNEEKLRELNYIIGKDTFEINDDD